MHFNRLVANTDFLTSNKFFGVTWPRW